MGGKASNPRLSMVLGTKAILARMDSVVLLTISHKLFSRYFGYGGWTAAYASISIWGLLFIFYTQFSVWKNKQVAQS